MSLTKCGCSIMNNGWNETLLAYLIFLANNFLMQFIPQHNYLKHLVWLLIFPPMLSMLQWLWGLLKLYKFDLTWTRNCKLVGIMITTQHSHVVWPCASHYLNFIVEDICKLDYLKNVIEIVRSMLMKFVMKNYSLYILWNMWGKQIFLGMLRDNKIFLNICLNWIYFKYILIILNNLFVFK